MRQMINTVASAFDRIPFGDFTEGFFRRISGYGKIFYVNTDLALDSFMVFPVLENGLVSKCGDADVNNHPNPKEEVEVIRAKDLGIKEVEWTDESVDSKSQACAHA